MARKNSVLHTRSQIFQAVRTYFVNKGFLEVETPYLIPANAPEEYIEPVFTSLSSWQLQTSPEICMKRLLCRGYTKIFQISRCWRSNERGNKHLPEFTMLEWYRAESDYLDLIDDCHGLLNYIANTCTEDCCFKTKKNIINPNKQWQNFSVKEAFTKFTKFDLFETLKQGLFEDVMTSYIEPGFEQYDVPVILSDYPAQLAALARLKSHEPEFAERFELYIGGIELANGFSELSDPVEQRTRFDVANQTRIKCGNPPLPFPEVFLKELSSMPSSAGIAMGLDRLVMLSIGTDNIDDVVTFTPEFL